MFLFEGRSQEQRILEAESIVWCRLAYPMEPKIARITCLGFNSHLAGERDHIPVWRDKA